MPSLLQTGAAWLGAQLQTHAGQTCEYRHGGWAISASIVPIDSDASLGARDVLGLDGVTARGDDYLCLASTLEFGEARFLPEAGDELEWSEDSGQSRLSVVFPRVDERCYRYHGPTDIRLRIYTVRAEDLIAVEINTGGAAGFSAKGIPQTVRGQELFDSDTTKLLTTAVYIPRVAFAAQNITSPPLMATVKLGDDTRAWAVNMSETEWGAGLVKLGVQREHLVREYQAQRNAAAV